MTRMQRTYHDLPVTIQQLTCDNRCRRRRKSATSLRAKTNPPLLGSSRHRRVLPTPKASQEQPSGKLPPLQLSDSVAASSCSASQTPTLTETMRARCSLRLRLATGLLRSDGRKRSIRVSHTQTRLFLQRRGTVRPEALQWWRRSTLQSAVRLALSRLSSSRHLSLLPLPRRVRFPTGDRSRLDLEVHLPLHPLLRSETAHHCPALIAGHQAKAQLVGYFRRAPMAQMSSRHRRTADKQAEQATRSLANSYSSKKWVL